MRRAFLFAVTAALAAGDAPAASAPDASAPPPAPREPPARAPTPLSAAELSALARLADSGSSTLLPPVAEYAALRASFDAAFERMLSVASSAPPAGTFSNGTLVLADGRTASIYLNRELSWLAFNRRVIAEAESARHPLLERLRFLSISFNNLDEFYMVRIAGLTQLVKTLVDGLSADGLSPSAQLAQTVTAAGELIALQQRVWAALQAELRATGTAALVSCDDLSADDRAYLHRLFLDELWPQLTPQSIDNAHPFPFVGNKGMGIALSLQKRKPRAGNADAAVIGPRARKRKVARRGQGEDSFLADADTAAASGDGAGADRHYRTKAASISSAGDEHIFEMETTHAAIPDEMRAILLLPPQLRRFLRLPSRGNASATPEMPRFVLVEDMLTSIELDGFFPERELRERGMFRVLRDSEVEVDEEAVDLVRMFETALKRRRKGVAIRLDVDKGMPPSMREWLASAMGLPSKGVIVVDGLVGLGDVSQIISEAVAAAGFRAAELVFAPFTARIPERVTRELPERASAKGSDGGIFAAIRAKDILVHHPFESFETVLIFVRAAANDPSVVAIKQTLYRTSENSPIVSALIEAAESGKTVTALIELKARFDEEANIRWAKDMERAGVHVVYGFRELKTHAKIALVVRKEANGLQSYVHMVRRQRTRVLCAFPQSA
jgi:polyphosphate kinase